MDVRERSDEPGPRAEGEKCGVSYGLIIRQAVGHPTLGARSDRASVASEEPSACKVSFYDSPRYINSEFSSAPVSPLSGNRIGHLWECP